MNTYESGAFVLEPKLGSLTQNNGLFVWLE